MSHHRQGKLTPPTGDREASMDVGPADAVVEGPAVGQRIQLHRKVVGKIELMAGLEGFQG
ncbi:hypothetical protein [Sphingobium agri]|uniref:Uncharacterized protein n=1 Tax=Sphingobium agri TaxID=2933566 RepID=A0ABT0DUQ8_9SPHN|nr:hypothetical protein [Sphingobium agri]MCK0530848.1 hypothetical protein [Sphingobium agri]